MNSTLLNQKFPLVIQPSNNLQFNESLDYIKQEKQSLLSSLAREGALLFRHFPITCSQEKRQILQALDVTLESEYPFGISPRTALDEAVFKSTEVPGNFPLAAHTEMSYLPSRPAILAFHCVIEPQQYGETPLFDMRAVFMQLSEDYKTRLRTTPIQYRHCYPKTLTGISKNIGLTWPRIFQTNEKEEVTKLLEQQGFEYSWTKQDHLEYKTVVPAIIRHPITGLECLNLLLIHPYVTYRAFDKLRSRQSFLLNKGLLLATLLYNAVGRPSTSVCFKDNQKIPYPMVKEICDLTWKNASIFPWQKNDLLMVDNIAIAHGRMNVVGPRKITVSLGNTYTVNP